jgi:hypothetical protein
MGLPLRRCTGRIGARNPVATATKICWLDTYLDAVTVLFGGTGCRREGFPVPKFSIGDRHNGGLPAFLFDRTGALAYHIGLFVVNPWPRRSVDGRLCEIA